MPEQSFRYFRNDKCKFFPCHKNIDPENFNCLFCYCPLDSVINCGGNYSVLKDARKDCSQCVYPHIPENYPEIVEKVKKLLQARRFPEDGETI